MVQLKGEIERGEYVNSVVFKHLAIAQEQASVEACAKYLRENLNAQRWFVYEGGSHVALHLARPERTQQGVRIALIKEVK